MERSVSDRAPGNVWDEPRAVPACIAVFTRVFALFVLVGTGHANSLVFGGGACRALEARRAVEEVRGFPQVIICFRHTVGVDVGASITVDTTSGFRLSSRRGHTVFAGWARNRVVEVCRAVEAFRAGS